MPVPGNGYHGEATGSFSKTKRRRLAEKYETVIPLDGDEAQRQLDEKLGRDAKKAVSEAAQI